MSHGLSPTAASSLVRAVDLSTDARGTSVGQQVLTVARQEYALSLRNRWALALTVLFAARSLLVGALVLWSTVPVAQTTRLVARRSV